ncbi:putative fluoride ion transporter CrcB [Aliiroseovarius zhejiangensis]|uniref:Fluoride-specific ion channel FluC n=1 Tax=Aliiroseovarius zhejiangensis TaxID=1632025 RepID=A0ABQ3J4Q8_9RHOB|nr:fluoride efflux transporter CrcB [Aliiroseovarius zhejiangensis]GHF00949.1 putative fluoride ion transporter CrcB [Aliiroseovarius zhejiangensis]
MMTPLLQVALGGAIGASARYLSVNAYIRAFGTGFPAGTMIVNVLGSFLIGIVVVFLARKELTHISPLLMTGFLGGFTTFSAYSLEAYTLFERGQMGSAALYAVGTVVLSILALIAGVMLTRMVLA